MTEKEFEDTVLIECVECKCVLNGKTLFICATDDPNVFERFCVTCYKGTVKEKGIEGTEVTND